ncbi:T9SS type A sorting domain-containing protein [Flavobacterium piscinae]|uniref:T9SS type A sorting domain-containing protein n=2 Tax=Flavobacterium piscinae TaxID=2506424 RepID=A0A4Q1KU10_9FLAO|nr:T9SS type A sorting domain-containing protein [Flavobacterium piscinae]
MRYLYLFMICLFFQFSISQNLLWENVYPNPLVLGKMIAVDSEDKIISVGNGFNQTGYANYIYTQKMDSEGNLIWKDSVSTTLPNNSHRATWTGTDSNNNIIVVGYQFTLSLQNENPNAIKVLKYSPTGELLYNVSIPGTFNSGDIMGIRKRNLGAIDELDNLYIGTAGITNTLSQAGFVLLKLSSGGELLWERVKSFGNVHGIHGMNYKNGKIVLVGNTMISGYNNQYAVWNADGDLIWSGNSQNNNQTWATDVLLDNSGNTFSLTQTYVGSDPSIELTKYDTNGNVVFSQTYDIQVAATSGRLKVLSTGELIISGTNWSTSGENKLYVAKVSPIDGSILYQNEQLLSQSNNWVYDMIVSVNDNYYIIGNSNNNGGAPSATFIYAYSAQNGFEWSTSYNIQGTEPMAIVLDSQEKIYTVIQNKFTVVKFGNSLSENLSLTQNNKRFTIYPNPTNDFLNFQLEDGNTNSIRLIDINGREIYRGEIINNQLDVSNLTTGLYFGIIDSPNFESFTFKFVKK